MSVPDAKFTMGEFEVSMPLGVPQGHLGDRRGRILLGGLEGSFKALFSAAAFFHLITSVLLCTHFTDEQTKVWGSLALGPWQMPIGDGGPGPSSPCLTLLLGYYVPWGRPLATTLST